MRYCQAQVRGRNLPALQAAAGLLAAMSRLSVRSPAACGILVARVLAGVAGKVAAAPLMTATQSSAAAARAAAPPTVRGYNGEARDGVPLRRMPQGYGSHVPYKVQGEGRSSFSSISSSGGGGCTRRGGSLSRRADPRKRRAARRAQRRVCRLLELGPRRAAQLRWVCVALSTLLRLRIPSSSLPRRAVSKLLW
jgi:hypothetical protein